MGRGLWRSTFLAKLWNAPERYALEIYLSQCSCFPSGVAEFLQHHYRDAGRVEELRYTLFKDGYPGP